jgi:hypothetical protein
VGQLSGYGMRRDGQEDRSHWACDLAVPRTSDTLINHV